jgi:hypothetical protein
LQLAKRPSQQLGEATVVLATRGAAGTKGSRFGLGLRESRDGYFHGVVPFFAKVGLRVAISVASPAATSGFR